jgi:hemolysin activation/secretion protein
MMSRLFLVLLGCLAWFAPLGSAAAPVPAAESKVHHLRQILFADSIEGAQALQAVPNGGFIVIPASLPMLDRKDLLKRLESGENRVLDDRLLAAIAQVVEIYMKSIGYAIATVIIPPQSIAEGTLRVAILPGKVRNIKFEGNRWFSESLLREKMRLERGNLVRISELERTLATANNSPFRRVKLHVEPVPDTGEADLFFGVQDRLPIRFTAGYDNTGNEILGYDRYSGALTYGNLWGREHQLTYQQVISHSTTLLRMHAVDYRAPLPWRHVVSVSGSIARVNPTFYDGLFTQKGESINGDAKYVVPFRFKSWEGELTAGVMFRQSDNNLEFGGAPAFGSKHDLLAGSISAALVRPDARGRWILSATVTSSAGEFNSRSEADDYNAVRVGARPQYTFANFWAQRVTALTPRLNSLARVSAQLAGTNLLPSEQFSAGGAHTVRGYEDRILSGDGGYVATHELIQTLPSISLGKKIPQLDVSGALFWDYGRTLIKHPLIGETKSAYVSSVGVGVRLTIANYLSASADLARQLEQDETPGARHHRLHVKVSLTY